MVLERVVAGQAAADEQGIPLHMYPPLEGTRVQTGRGR